MRKRGCERLRQAPVLWQKDVRMGMAANGFCPPSAGLQRNQWCTFSFLPQQGHLLFFRQLGIVDADLPHQDIHAHPEFPRIVFHGLRHPYVKPTTKKFASFLKFFRAAAIAARSCSIRYSWLMLPFQISPFLKSPA